MPEREPRPRDHKNSFERESVPERERAIKAEGQPERGWFLEEEKPLLEVTHIYDHGKKYVEAGLEYKKGVYAARIQLTLQPDDVRLEVVRYLLQIYHKKISDLPSRTIVKVGLTDHEKVAFLVFEHTDADHRRDLEQYFFEKDGSPGGYKTNRISIPSWPLNRPQIVYPYMLPHFNELGDTLSDAAAVSLRNAVAKLMKPAREFKSF